MKTGDTITFWRDCPACGGKGYRLANAFIADINRLAHPDNMVQCQRCVEEKAKQDALAATAS